MDRDQFEKLMELADNKEQVEQQKEDYGPSPEMGSLRFGILNLICCFSDWMYNTWRQGTGAMKAMAPVTCEEAAAFFIKLRGEEDAF